MYTKECNGCGSWNSGQRVVGWAYLLGDPSERDTIGL